jgi:hypothetical protein
LQPREINTRKVGQAEPLMSRRRQQTASPTRMDAGRPRGMGGEHADTVGYGTGETRPGSQRRGPGPRCVRRRRSV